MKRDSIQQAALGLRHRALRLSRSCSRTTILLAMAYTLVQLAQQWGSSRAWLQSVLEHFVRTAYNEPPEQEKVA